MSQRRIFSFGLLFTLLALAAQLASGAVVPRIEAATALAYASTICHVDGTSDQTLPAPHHPADCPICPLCTSFSSPAFSLAAHPVLPAPREVAVVAASVVPPPATAPPTLVALAARPRGPPTILA